MILHAEHILSVQFIVDAIPADFPVMQGPGASKHLAQT